MTPLRITIDPACVPEVQDNCVQWLAEVQAWSEARYPEADLGEVCTINIETHIFSAISIKPQLRPIEVRASEVDVVTWDVELVKEQWFKSGLFYVGHRVGLQTAFAGIFRCVQHTVARDLKDDDYREGWDRVEVASQERLDWLREHEPELLDSWVDRSGWLTDHVSGLRKNRWQFPALNPKLCRYGTWGPGAVFPENAGRK
jgi:hypothetical protein